MSLISEISVCRWTEQVPASDFFTSLRSFLEVLKKLSKVRIRVCHQFSWRVVLQQLAKSKAQDIVTVDDCVDSVGDHNHCGVFEFRIDKLLDGLLGDNIDISRSLIQNDNLRSSQDSSADTD